MKKRAKKKRVRKEGMYLSGIGREGRETLGHMTLFALTWSQLYEVALKRDHEQIQMNINRLEMKLLRRKPPAIRCQPNLLKSGKRHS